MSSYDIVLERNKTTTSSGGESHAHQLRLNRVNHTVILQRPTYELHLTGSTARGLQGIPGTNGTDGEDGEGDKTYSLPFTNSSSITVTHNLGKYPSVTIIDTAGDEVEGTVRHNSMNQATITLSSGTSGVVYLN